MSSADEEAFAKLMQRVHHRLHAMQTGVSVDHQTQPSSQEAHNKHLRVGVNNALLETSALVLALERAGILSKVEFAKALEELVEQEVKRYEKLLSARLGYPVTLA